MPKPKAGAGENSKKAQGQARKAEAAAGKAAAADKIKASQEDAEWSKGSKSNAKAQAAADKQAEAARKKAEKEALLKEEEASLPTKAGKGNAKTAQKKTRGGGLDAALAGLDGGAAEPKRVGSLNATGIDNALDALSITNANGNDKIDRHPERRFKAAYAAYEERRLEEMADEKGLRRNQKIEQIRKEFEKHPDNPFNQVAGKFNSTREELAEIKEAEKMKTEARLAGA